MTREEYRRKFGFEMPAWGIPDAGDTPGALIAGDVKPRIPTLPPGYEDGGGVETLPRPERRVTDNFMADRPLDTGLVRAVPAASPDTELVRAVPAGGRGVFVDGQPWSPSSPSSASEMGMAGQRLVDARTAIEAERRMVNPGGGGGGVAPGLVRASALASPMAAEWDAYNQRVRGDAVAAGLVRPDRVNAGEMADYESGLRDKAQNASLAPVYRQGARQTLSEMIGERSKAMDRETQMQMVEAKRPVPEGDWTVDPTGKFLYNKRTNEHVTLPSSGTKLGANETLLGPDNKVIAENRVEKAQKDPVDAYSEYLDGLRKQYFMMTPEQKSSFDAEDAAHKERLKARMNPGVAAPVVAGGGAPAAGGGKRVRFIP